MACCDGHPKDWPALDKMFFFILKIFVDHQCLFPDVHLFTPCSRWHSTLYCACNLRSAHLQNLGQMPFSLITVWSCFIIRANKLDHYLDEVRSHAKKKSLEKVKPELSWIDFWNLLNVSPKFIESLFCSKKKSQLGLVLKIFKALYLLQEFLVWNIQATRSDGLF